MDELQIAEKMIIRSNQLNFITNDFENFSKLKHELNIQLDDNGLYRCYGRLQNANVNFESKFPILLDRKHETTKLIVRNIHLGNKHCGLKQCLNELRQRFWVSRGRGFVRSVLLNCTICRRFIVKPFDYPNPPPLTSLRLNDSRPFVVVGVDLCGPLYVKDIFETVLMHKAWVVLYTCAASRGIVLDLVNSLDSKTFVSSLRKFISRRGCPDHIISDNGTNFISQQTQAFAQTSNIRWHFNIPLAPWQGGFFERIIRIIKYHLKRHLEKSKLNFNELLTVLLELS